MIDRNEHTPEVHGVNSETYKTLNSDMPGSHARFTNQLGDTEQQHRRNDGANGQECQWPGVFRAVSGDDETRAPQKNEDSRGHSFQQAFVHPMSVDVAGFGTVAHMTNEELLATACPIINEIGPAFYFIPETSAVGKELGLRGMEFYVLGRGGPLGDCDGGALAAAFGYFKPSMIGGIWDDARSRVDPRTAGRAHLECCAAFGRAKMSGVANLDALVAALDAVNNAADPDGLGLYAAMRTEPLATDAPARAMQLVALLREFRGSAHLIALRASGIDTKTAHHVKRPDMVQAFGYTEEDAPTITDATHAKMAAAEALTDALCAPAYAVLSEADRAVLASGVAAMKQALTA